MNIHLLTFNIHHGKGVDRKLDLDRIAEVIKASHADIIGLNEVDKHFSKRSEFIDQIGWLANQLNMYYVFSPSLSLKLNKSSTAREYGNALLSRYPIVNEKNYRFNLFPGLTEGRSILEATIQINNKFLKIYVTHLSLNPILHRKQTDFIIRQFQLAPQPLIIMGDWNMKPQSIGWRKITREFYDVWTIAGMGAGYTYPSLQPRSRIDYIFASHHFHIKKAEIITCIPKSSDHLPLKATISFS
ncbi:endonuclease/exonuclease/phosphatase family protein [Bacillus sp. BRMEA1]|uniref:endonuclease/exonuclease/phosphatase family protein n=1 Tax=Neobacillus endophyticus TaxID=2738405 RepID=UPI0015658FB1|nr:endonuclease/exonuclease/phosphatase family protein [Neobacillus endophyticus]NRD79575.1 endonuclease/exonuclease/phosphatase family protein [Neobacillus endophyticus]